MTLTYHVVLKPEPDGSAFTAHAPAMPGAITWGETVEEALVAAQEALALHRESYAECGQPSPADLAPSEPSFVVTVQAPAIRTRRSASGA